MISAVPIPPFAPFSDSEIILNSFQVGYVKTIRYSSLYHHMIIRNNYFTLPIFTVLCQRICTTMLSLISSSVQHSAFKKYI